MEWVSIWIEKNKRQETKMENYNTIIENNNAGSKRQIYILIAIFSLAFLLRFVHLNQLQANNPFFNRPILDSQFYDEQAQQIAGGDLLGKEVFFMGPLYPYLMALVYRVFGHNIYLLLLLQVLLGSLTCVFIYLIARKLFSTGVAVTAGVMAALYSIFVFYDSMIMIASLSVFLTVFLLYSLLSFHEKPSYPRIFWTGVILGLSIITRPNILLLIPLILLWLWMERSRLASNINQPEFKNKRLFTLTFLFLVGTGLVISMVTIRNYLVGRDLVLVTSSGGINFYIGNNAQATGTYMDPLGMGKSAVSLKEESAKNACVVLGRDLKPSEVSGFWMKEGLRFIFENPWKYLQLLARKFFLLWNGYESPVNQNYYFLKQYSAVLRLPLVTFGLVCPFALVGMILCLRQWRRLFPLYAMLAAYMAALALFFILAHYRVPLVPIMIIFAGYTVSWLVKQIKDRKWLPLICVLVMIGSCAVFTNLPTKELDFSNEYYNLGVVYNQVSLYQEAVPVFQKAIELNKNNASVYANLGVSYQRLGMANEAIAVFQKALELEPDRVSVYNNLGSVYLKMEKYDDAALVLQKAITIDPGYALAYYNLGYAYDRQGRTEEAIKAYQKAIALKPDYAYAHNNLGLIYARQGKLIQAVAEWEKVLEIDPMNESVRRNHLKAQEMITK